MKIIRKPIEMISYSTTEGDLKPIKFRFISDEQSWISIKVDKIIKKDIEKLAGNKMIVYTCQSIIEDIEQVYEIKYEIETQRWMLFKI